MESERTRQMSEDNFPVKEWINLKTQIGICYRKQYK